MSKAKLLEKIFFGCFIVLVFCAGAIVGMTILKLALGGQL
jgi:hypothetical protein